MKKLMPFVAVLAVGCTPDLWLRPTIPTAPPERPATFPVEPVRPRAPVNPSQVTEQNAREKLSELEAELEADANRPR